MRTEDEDSAFFVKQSLSSPCASLWKEHLSGKDSLGEWCVLFSQEVEIPSEDASIARAN